MAGHPPQECRCPVCRETSNRLPNTVDNGLDHLSFRSLLSLPTDSRQQDCLPSTVLTNEPQGPSHTLLAHHTPCTEHGCRSYSLLLIPVICLWTVPDHIRPTVCRCLSPVRVSDWCRPILLFLSLSLPLLLFLLSFPPKSSFTLFLSSFPPFLPLPPCFPILPHLVHFFFYTLLEKVSSSAVVLFCLYTVFFRNSLAP